jgi:DNA-binding winged helix-turn-helix (wHTH) protein
VDTWFPRPDRDERTVESSSLARDSGDVQTLRFGAFEMDLRSGELRRNGHLIRLQPQPFKVLGILLRTPGDVVSREEIQREVWPEGTFVDFEQSLNFCVRQIRGALGDNAVRPRFVETLPRRGYRWVGGAVERVADPATVREWPRPLEPRPSNGDGGREPSGGRDRVAGRPWVLMVVATAAALAGGLGVWAVLPTVERSPPEFRRLTFRRGSITTARFAPGGRVVYAASWEGRPPVLHLVGREARDTRELDIDWARIAATSASEVAFLRDGVLSRAPIAGGPPRAITEGVRAADWSRDASRLAVVRSEGGGSRLEYPRGTTIAETAGWMRWLRLSPDGNRLAVEEHPLHHDDRGRVVVYDGAGRLLAASPVFGSLEGLAWSPDGDEVWFTAAEVGADSNLRALSLDGEVRTLLSAMGRLVLHDAAPDGTALVERSTLCWETYSRKAGRPGEVELTWLDLTGVEGLSADGSVALLVESGEGGGPDYTSFLRRTDGSLPVRLGPGRATSLSRDGRWVTMIPVGRPDHVEVMPTGAGERRRYEVPGATTYEMAGWLPDGKTLYVTARDEAGHWGTWLVDTASGEARPLPLPEGRMVYRDSFSPDGSRLVARCPDENPAYCVYEAESGDSRPLAGTRPEWQPVAWDDEDRVYFRDRQKVVPEVLWRLHLETRRIERVAEIAPRDRAGVLGLTRVLVARSGDAWVYSLARRLSDLYIVSGIEGE